MRFRSRAGRTGRGHAPAPLRPLACAVGARRALRPPGFSYEFCAHAAGTAGPDDDLARVARGHAVAGPPRASCAALDRPGGQRRHGSVDRRRHRSSDPPAPAEAKPCPPARSISRPDARLAASNTPTSRSAKKTRAGAGAHSSHRIDAPPFPPDPAPHPPPRGCALHLHIPPRHHALASRAVRPPDRPCAPQINHRRTVAPRPASYRAADRDKRPGGRPARAALPPCRARWCYQVARSPGPQMHSIL